MGTDAKALHRLWREKRGEVAAPDLSRDLLVQLGSATEALNRSWFERETRLSVTSVQRFVRHRTLTFMGASLDGLVAEEAVSATTVARSMGAVFEAKFMLPWSFSEEAAAEKHMAQLQHNMLVSGCPRAYLSIITGGSTWVLIEGG